MKEFFIQALRYALKNDEVVKGKPLLDLADEGIKSEVRSDSRKNAQGESRETLRDKTRTKA